jgi:hypothetical protein
MTVRCEMQNSYKFMFCCIASEWGANSTTLLHTRYTSYGMPYATILCENDYQLGYCNLVTYEENFIRCDHMLGRRGIMVSIPASYSKIPGQDFLSGSRLSSEFFRDFLSPSMEILGVVPQNRPRPLPLTSFPIRHSK